MMYVQQVRQATRQIKLIIVPATAFPLLLLSSALDSYSALSIKFFRRSSKYSPSLNVKHGSVTRLSKPVQ